MHEIKQLSDEVILRIVQEMRTGVFSRADRLPPEVELAQLLGVSRSAVRECLARLEREGMVNRKHGVGTLINRQVVAADHRLDLTGELIPLLEQSGKKARTAFTRILAGKAEGEAMEKLQLEPGAELIIAERLICADDKPAVYCIDYIPAALVTGGPFRDEDFQPSVFDFLRKFCGVEVNMYLAELRALPAEGRIAEGIQVPEGFPLLCLAEAGFSFFGKSVLYSEEYFTDRVIRHVILRKKI
jgi:GntR family transcriptional regulator